MGKFAQIKKHVEKQAEEPQAVEEPETSDEELSDDSDLDETTKQPKEKKRAVLWTNRERVLVLCSRGADVRTRHLMNDIKDLLPHAKGDSKLDKQKTLTVVNEIAEMKNCTKILYFESRKHKDHYLWISNVDGGPSVKFLLHNIHTMMELRLSGNCLKASRPILSFDSKFDELPHLTLIKHSLIQTFGTPNHHPRSQPFVDHVFSFSVTPDNKIWFRNFQIVDETLQLQEIGPRFVMETIRIFDGSFEGAVLYDNPDYESPNATRRAAKLDKKGKTIEKELHHKSEAIKSDFIKETLKTKMVDQLNDELFNTERDLHDDEAVKMAEKIDESVKRKIGAKDAKKAAKKAKYGSK